MDKPLAIHDKKTTKPKHRQNSQKSKKKLQQDPTTAPVKVVYIGNPVNFNSSASEFRSLVQQLTGKHSCASDNGVGGLERQESVVDSGHASMDQVKDPENIVVADHETEEIASSSSLNCPTTKSNHNSDLLDIVGHQAVHNDNVYDMPDQMLDNYLPPDFWYDQY